MRVVSRLVVLPIAAALSVAVSAPMASAVSVASPQVIRFHGGGYDSVGAIVVDAQGNTILAGSTESANNNITFSVTKLNRLGELVWRRAYSGARGGVGGRAEAVTVDAAGNVYAAGTISNGAIFGANIDALVVKLGPDGVERWAQRYDGPAGGFDQATEAVLDRAGALYISGRSQGSGFDWVTQRYSTDGTPQWTRRLGGPASADDEVGDVVLAPNGNVVVAGVTKNLGDGVTNDIEIVMYDPQGAVAWQRRWSDTPASHETVRDMDIAADGRIAVTGSSARTASPEFGVPLPITAWYDASGALLQATRTGGDAVDNDANGSTYVVGSFRDMPQVSTIAKYSPGGSLDWATPLVAGLSQSLSITAIAVDAFGMITVAGDVSNVTTLNRDFLTIRFAADGRELWRHQFNGTGNGEDRVAGLVVDGENTALVAGTSWSNSVSSGGTADDMVTLRFPAGVTPPSNPPASLTAPTQLTVSSPSRSQIRLNWKDNSAAEAGFRVERCRGSGCANLTQVAVLGPDVVTYLDSALVRNTTYTYRVRAFNADDASAFSNTAMARTRSS